MKTPTRRKTLLLAIVVAIAVLGGCAALVNAASNANAVESVAGGTAQGQDAQSPYSIPF